MEQTSINSSPLWLAAAKQFGARRGAGLAATEVFDDMEIAHLDARFHGQQARIAFGTDASDALVMKFGGTEAGVAGWTMMSDQDYRDGLAAGDDMAEGHRRHGAQRW